MTRLASLDAFRGLTIAAMILVTNQGSDNYVYAPLDHAPWHGWTVADLAFPFFLFAVGASLVLSFARRTAAGATRGQLARRALARMAVLVALGLLLNSLTGPDLGAIRLPGVLQRIGIVYLITALLVLYASPRVRVGTVIVVLLGYWLLLAVVPVPGLGAPSLDPGSNLPAWLDRDILGRHMWTPTFDPEGILSTLPAIATCLFGAFAGRWLLARRASAEIAAGLLVSGNVLLVLGLIWDIGIPINKNLWTSSYVAFTAGAALVTLGTLYWIVEVCGRRRWAWPLHVFGSNALFVFVLSALVAAVLFRVRIGSEAASVSLHDWLFVHAFASWAGPFDGSLLFAIATVLFWLAVMAVLYQRRWFVRL